MNITEDTVKDLPSSEIVKTALAEISLLEFIDDEEIKSEKAIISNYMRTVGNAAYAERRKRFKI